MSWATRAINPFPAVSGATAPSDMTDAEFRFMRDFTHAAYFHESGGMESAPSQKLLRWAERRFESAPRYLNPISATDAPILVPTANGRKGLLHGYQTAGGAPNAGDQGRVLVGGGGLDIPNDVDMAEASAAKHTCKAFTAVLLADIVVGAATINTIMGFGSASDNSTWSLTTGDQMRFTVRGALTARTANGVVQAGLRAYALIYDGAAATLQRGTTVLDSRACVIPKMVRPLISVGGSLDTLGVYRNGLEATAVEGFFVSPTTDPAYLAALFDMVESFHPGFVRT